MLANDSLVNVIGLMSGTSLDGLDIAYVRFKVNKNIEFELIQSTTIPYSQEWKQKLSDAFHSGAEELKRLDEEYGVWIGNSVLQFINQYHIVPDLVSSHGHTIFHKPSEKYTLQIGSGIKIHELTQLPVINNFRAQDVALGGQGAPLVPVGDELLFSEYDFCLNLGGFSNISWKMNGKRLACDIGPCNILLNEICKKLGVGFDEDGNLARQGKISPTLLEKWNQLSFYKLEAPKSLGREWFESNFLDDIQQESHSANDLLATAVFHIVHQISTFVRAIINKENSIQTNYTILCTGGGAHNIYLMKQLQESVAESCSIVLPDKGIIDFKEAIVFALLGLLRWRNENNILAAITGASRDHSSGDVYYGPNP